MKIERDRVFTFALSLSVVLILVTLVELALRINFARQVGWDALLFGIVAPRAQIESVNPRYHDRVMGDGTYSKYFPYQNKRLTIGGESFQIAINKHGFRGPDFERNKQPGTIRIVTLGGSSTFGYGPNHDHQTYPARIRA